MGLITQRIASLLGGVSQLPKNLRGSHQLDEQINGVSRVSDGGPSKRPGSTHLATLTETVTGYAEAFVHSIHLSNTQRYLLTIANETLRLFDRATGLSQAIAYPLGNTYINIEPVDDVDILADTFTDTNGTDLADHVSDSGAVWSQIDGAADAVQIQGNVAEQLYNGDPLADAEYRLQYEVPADDYTVSANVRMKSSSQKAGEVFLKLRANGTDRAGYAVRVLTATDLIQLSIIKLNAAGATDSTIAAATAHGSATVYEYHKVSLRVTGNFLEAMVDDVVLCSGTDAVSPINTGGYVHLRVENPSTVDRRWLIDDFRIVYSPPALVSNDKYRAVTVDDKTYIVNTSVTVAKGTAKAPVQTPTALLYLEQADFGTRYEVTIDGLSTAITTAVSTDASARAKIATDVIAEALADQLASVFPAFTIDRFGSFIRVVKTDETDFTITTTDGLGDNGLVCIKGAVQSADELPFRCIDGHILEVVGNANDATDQYWVKFDVTSSDDHRGVWRETARPGEGIALNPLTLPHELVYSDELTHKVRHARFSRLPVIYPSTVTKNYPHFSTSLNGGALSVFEVPRLDDHNDELFVNLDGANGGTVKVGLRFRVDTANMTDGDTLHLSIEYNDGVASTAWTTAEVLSYGPGVYEIVTHELDINADIADDFDLRLSVTYESGATPDDKGKIIFASDGESVESGVYFYAYLTASLTFVPDEQYPRGTAWTVVVDGETANYTQTADMTGTEVADALEPLIEALTGITSSVGTNKKGYAIVIGGASGYPTVTVSNVLDPATRFWNPDLNLEETEDTFVGKILRNLSDGSEGIITESFPTGFVVDALTGGTDNVFNVGDLCVVAETAKRWVFRPMDWTDRDAGDSVTNPWPSIFDRRISEVFYHRGRLGLLSGGNVVMSEVNKPENLWRTATTQLLDSDPIDVRPMTTGTAAFSAAVEWDGKMLLFTESAQYELSGEPLLTPKSVSLKLLTRYNSNTTRPVVLGSRIYFTRGMERFTRVFEYKHEANIERPVAEDITRFVPRYLEGEPMLMVGDPSLGMLLVRTDADPSHLYVYSFEYSGQDRILSSWSRWEFADGEIVGLDFADGLLALLVYRADGVFLEEIDLDEVSAAGTHLDRMIESDDISDAHAAGTTTWTLPFSVATDGSEGVVQVIDASGNLLTTTRPTATTVACASGDFTAQNCTIGIRFTFSVTLSTLFLRDREGNAETRGRTQVRSLKVAYADTRDFTVSVTNDSRAARTTTLDEATATEGELRVPVLAENKQATITISNATPNPSRITGIDWEGFHTARGQRV